MGHSREAIGKEGMGAKKYVPMQIGTGARISQMRYVPSNEVDKNASQWGFIAREQT